jgi:uncharacterized membrane protein YfcA
MELVELTNSALAAICAAIIVASIISSVTGMAGGLLMFTAMGLYIPLMPLIAIHGAVQVFANGSRSVFLWSAVRRRMCLPFAFGAMLGAAATTAFIARYLHETVPLLLLTLLIGYTLFKPARLPSLKIADHNFFWVGIATGSLGIVAGAIDPLLAAFFIRDDLSREQVVANKSMMQLITHLTKIPAFLYLGFNYAGHLSMIALFSIAGVLGTWFGVYLLGHMNNQWFFRLMRIALALAGLRLLWQLYLSLVAA